MARRIRVRRPTLHRRLECKLPLLELGDLPILLLLVTRSRLVRRGAYPLKSLSYGLEFYIILCIPARGDLVVRVAIVILLTSKSWRLIILRL